MRNKADKLAGSGSFADMLRKRRKSMQGANPDKMMQEHYNNTSATRKQNKAASKAKKR